MVPNLSDSFDYFFIEAKLSPSIEPSQARPGNEKTLAFVFLKAMWLAWAAILFLRPCQYKPWPTLILYGS